MRTQINKRSLFGGTILAAGLIGASPATADEIIDQQNAGPGSGWAYLNPVPQNSQTFISQLNTICGGGIYLGAQWGNGTIQIGIYTTDPYLDGGANPLVGAIGSAYGTAGNWVDVSWADVAITPGQTYWLAPTNLSGGNPVVNWTLNDEYADGGLHYLGFDYTTDGYDLVFRTWAPAPGSAALLGFAGLVATRRRR